MLESPLFEVWGVCQAKSNIQTIHYHVVRSLPVLTEGLEWLVQNFSEVISMALTIAKEAANDTLALTLEGRLDTTTAPQLEAELKTAIDGVKTLTFDMAKLAYISSAGLRVLLKAQKAMNKQGSMSIKNAGPEILEIFEVTGFDEILNIEK